MGRNIMTQDVKTESDQGIKFDKGHEKLRYDLIPPGPLAELAYVYTRGAEKYADRNWEKGMAWGRIFRAMIQHAFNFWMGRSRHEKGMHSLGSVAWCAFTLMQYEHSYPNLDTRPDGGHSWEPKDVIGADDI